MANSRWSYLQNPFDNATKGSYKRMYLMATDHFDKLKKVAVTDATVHDLLNLGLPAFKAFVAQYRKGGTDAATYRMCTATFEGFIAELGSTNIRRWDVEIQMDYDIVTPEYKALLPNGRAPFQTGAYDLRIDQVFSLADRLSAFANFNDLQTKVRDFGDTILKARSIQQGIEHSDKSNSDALGDRREELAAAMHCIFGKLIGLYFKDLSKVESFYELKYLRSSSSSTSTEEQAREILTLAIAANGEIDALQGLLNHNDIIRITNTGATAFKVYTLTNSNAQPVAVTDVEVGQLVTITVGVDDTLLMLKNEMITEAKALVELL